MLQLSCYTDLFSKITEKIIPLIFEPRIRSENFFNSLKIIASGIESNLHPSYNQVELYFYQIIKSNITYGFPFSPEYDIRRYNSLLEHVKHLAINTLFYGDINAGDSLKLFNEILLPNIDTNSIQIEIKWEMFSTQTISSYLNHDLLPRGSFALLESTYHYIEIDSVVMNYFKVGHYNAYNDAMTSLIQSIWEDQFVNAIKLKIPKSSIATFRKKIIDATLYFVFTFQGDEDIDVINNEMDMTIGEIYNKLFLSPNEQATNLYYDAILNYLNINEENDFSLWERSNRIFNVIMQERNHYEKGFNYTREKLKEQMGLNTQLKEFFHQIFFSQVQKLSIRIVAFNDEWDVNPKTKDRNETYALNSSITTYCFNTIEKLKKMMKKTSS